MKSFKQILFTCFCVNNKINKIWSWILFNTSIDYKSNTEKKNFVHKLLLIYILNILINLQLISHVSVCEWNLSQFKIGMLLIELTCPFMCVWLSQSIFKFMYSFYREYIYAFCLFIEFFLLLIFNSFYIWLDLLLLLKMFKFDFQRFKNKLKKKIDELIEKRCT